MSKKGKRPANKQLQTYITIYNGQLNAIRALD